MNWQEYILNVGQGQSNIEDLQFDIVYDNRDDIINNWQIHMLDLISEKEKETNTYMDELECLNNIKVSLMEHSNQLDSISLQLEDIINKALKL